MKKSNYFLFIGILLLFPMSLPAFEATTELHLKIMGTRDAAPPHLFEGSVFFTHKPIHPVRYVGIAFAHENFRDIHLFRRNEKGVLFFVYPVPEGLHSLDYRLVVDGLWTTDPTNPLRYRDAAGVSLSRFEVPPETPKAVIKSPVVNRRAGTVEFNLKAPAGKSIFLAGNWNGWDPFMHRFREVEPGLYTFSLRLLPGTYQYYFFSEGNRATDSLNPQRGVDAEGYEVSILRVTN